MNLESRKANMVYEIASLINDDPLSAPVLILFDQSRIRTSIIIFEILHECRIEHHRINLILSFCFVEFNFHNSVSTKFDNFVSTNISSGSSCNQL